MLASAVGRRTTAALVSSCSRRRRRFLHLPPRGPGPSSSSCCAAAAAACAPSSSWLLLVPSSSSSSSPSSGFSSSPRRRFGHNSTTTTGSGSASNDDVPYFPLSPASGETEESQSRSTVTVALLGPPNAGKSTLFNRLLDKRANAGSYRLSSEKKGRNRQQRVSGRLKGTGPGPGGARSRQRSTAGGSGMAIVSDVPGTTRDRRECWGRLGSVRFRLVDTAGVDSYRLGSRKTRQQNAVKNIVPAMMEQTLEAARTADVILLLFDARVGGLSTDLLETVAWLRKNAMPANSGGGKIFLLANKLEGEHWDYDGSPVLDLLQEEIPRLGLGDEALPVSALHGEGMSELAAILERATVRKRQALGLPPSEDEEEDSTGKKDDSKSKDKASNQVEKETKPLQMAVLGRQNVGKSTLVNALLRQDRVLVGPTPGLTRDAIAVEWMWQPGRLVQVVDTAGIRKRSSRANDSAAAAATVGGGGGAGAARNISEENNVNVYNNQNNIAIEDAAVQDALRAMKVADVAVLVLDAGARMLQRQELAIASAVLKEGRALVVAANKMDLILEEGYTRDDFCAGVRDQLEARFPLLRKTPIVPVSSLTGEAVDELMPAVWEARERWSRVIPTSVLNRWLNEVVKETPPPMVGGTNRPVKIKYMLQTKGRPPTFLLFGNADELPEHYVRYLTRHFQDAFEMYGMEVRLAVKKSAKANPYDESASSGSDGAAATRKRGGSGLGGRQARQQRLFRHLNATGEAPPSRKKRSKRSTSPRR